MKKTHGACVGQITPLTSVEASSQFILEMYFEKVDKAIYQIDQALFWENLQFMMKHKNHEIQYHLKKYDSEMTKTFDKLNNILNDFQDYKVKLKKVEINRLISLTQSLMSLESEMNTPEDIEYRCWD